MAGSLSTLRHVEVLRELAAFHANMVKVGDGDRWARPMDVGGTNGSHHGDTLALLARRGFVEGKAWRVGERCVNNYRITPKGEQELKDQNDKA